VGKNITITLYDSEEDVINTEQSGFYQEQVNKVAPFLTAPPTHEGYEVVVQA